MQNKCLQFGLRDSVTLYSLYTDYSNESMLVGYQFVQKMQKVCEAKTNLLFSG